MWSHRAERRGTGDGVDEFEVIAAWGMAGVLLVWLASATDLGILCVLGALCIGHAAYRYRRAEQWWD
jgi:CHASE2 domain-containing sensor protein